MASTIGANRLFLLTTVAGFFQGGDPKTEKKARLLETVEEITPNMWQSCQPTLSMGGRGGMYSKLKAVEMVTSFGIEAVIASGKEPDVVTRIMGGEMLGTRFPPRGKRLKSFRQWLRVGALISGKLVVDAGAEKVLRNNKSMRPAGITRVEEDITPYDHYAADEAFFASTSYCVLPMTQVDKRQIGDGKPGPITQQLLAAWGEMVGVDIVGQALRFAG